MPFPNNAPVLTIQQINAMHSILESIGIKFGPGIVWLFASLVIFLRYAIPATIVFWLVYKWKRNEWFFWKIQQKFPKNSQIREEVTYSLLTSLIFGGMAIGVFLLRKMGYGSLYFDISEHGWGYYFFTIGFMILAHDTYFYWMHRLMHLPRLFKWVHLVHHKSSNPTPYTSFSFHPLESVVEFGIIPLIALVMPIHSTALFLFTLWSIVFNILGHTGYEFSPSGFTSHRFFKWINTPTHHNMHHKYSACNYSLYFNFWDRVMGTNHPGYDQYFEQIKNRTRRQLQENTPKTPQQALKVGATLVLLLCGGLAFGQLSMKDIKSGHYGTPESRTVQADSMMRQGLSLNEKQVKLVHDLNLKYARRVEKEVVQANMGDWARYRKLSAIQNEKDAELKKVLNVEQFDKYAKKRDDLFWQAMKDYFF